MSSLLRGACTNLVVYMYRIILDESGLSLSGIVHMKLTLGGQDYNHNGEKFFWCNCSICLCTVESIYTKTQLLGPGQGLVRTMSHMDVFCIYKRVA